MSEKPKPGEVAWIDLTVEDADFLRDFYAAVTGWKPEPVDMGEYADFNMMDASGKSTAGVCHKRGGNADLPSQWLVYIVVDSLDSSIEECTKRGGQVIAGPKSMGQSRYCVIEDPAGAFAALYQA